MRQGPWRAWRDLLLYRLLVWLLSPLLLLYTLAQTLRGGDRRYLLERLGRYGQAEACDLWLHAASVGEVNAALPLLRLLLEREPALRLLVTTVTPTGAATVRAKLPTTVRHAYLPVDLPAAVYRFFTRFRPACCVVMETEIWPHLYLTAQRRGLPLAIVNGRLSPRTLGAPRWVRRLLRVALCQVDAVFARTDGDRHGFLALGMRPEKVVTLGNIKFAAQPEAEGPPITLPRPYVVAASTRDGEEGLLFSAWKAAATGGRLLVIAPRHPQRREEILSQLAAMTPHIAVRSRGEPISAETEIYLADTLGELQALMRGADLVFVGGSLVPLGGQNLLEPARLGKAVVVGPHMDNFADETATLLAREGVVQVAGSAELTDALERLLADAGARARLGNQARQVMVERADMAARYLAALAPLCPRLQGAEGGATESTPPGQTAPTAADPRSH